MGRRAFCGWIGVCLFAAMVGCSDSEEKSENASNPVVPTAHEAVADAFCKTFWTFRCGQISQCSCGVEDLETCVAGSVALCKSQVLTSLAEQGEINVEVNESALQDCQANLALASDCNPLGEIPPSCARIPRVTGECVDGFGCDEDGYCVDGECVRPLPEGAVCSRAPCQDGLRCDGVCVRASQEGDACESDAGCATGLACFNSTCRPPFIESASCDETMPCGPGLSCVSGICEPAISPCDPSDDYSCGVFAACRELSTRECRAMASPGASCTESPQCGDGYWCDNGRCSVAAAQTEPCSDGVWCAAGLACQFPDFVCGPIPERGDACALTLYGPSLCKTGLGCVNGICADMPGEDEPCTNDNRCAEPFGCSFERDGSFCKTKRAVGQPCENDSICQDGLFCDYRENMCAPVYSAGQECSLGNECGKNRSCLPDGNKFVCSALPASGQPCTDACAPGFECVTLKMAARCVPDVCVPAGSQ